MAASSIAQALRARSYRNKNRLVILVTNKPPSPPHTRRFFQLAISQQTESGSTYDGTVTRATDETRTAGSVGGHLAVVRFHAILLHLNVDALKSQVKLTTRSTKYRFVLVDDLESHMSHDNHISIA